MNPDIKKELYLTIAFIVGIPIAALIIVALGTFLILGIYSLLGVSL